MTAQFLQTEKGISCKFSSSVEKPAVHIYRNKWQQSLTPKEYDPQKKSPAMVDHQYSSHQNTKLAFSTALPTAAEQSSLTPLPGSLESQHLIGSGTNYLAGPRISLLPKCPTYPECAIDRNKCYNPTPWSS